MNLIAEVPNTTPSISEPALSVRDLVIEFGKGRSLLDVILKRPESKARAVDHVSFDIRRGEILGLVGESGSGKSTIAKTLMGIHRPTDGTVDVAGRSPWALSARELLSFRRSVQMVFQDPYGSLNPRLTVRNAIAEPLRVHSLVAGDMIDAEVDRLLSLVGLSSGFADRKPRALSGGQRQRVGLARALALRPSILVLDEPVAALDVSIQAQILNLLLDLRDDLRLTMLFVAHELGVVRQVADRVAVLYLGSLVEMGTADEIFDRPRHPYTQALIKAAPSLGAREKKNAALKGDLPSPYAIPSGCRFRTRCPKATELCAVKDPPTIRLSETQSAACHYAG